MNKERSKALSEEVDRLLRTGFILETFYLDWLANLALIKKKTGNLRVCNDFTNLNKACPIDNYPLLKIDQLVEATTRGMSYSASWMPIQATIRSRCTFLTRQDCIHHWPRNLLL